VTSNNPRKQRHEAATEQFALYKEYIVGEFIHKFGGSYQMPEQHMKTWRKKFDWTQEREDFIKEKTNFFICLLPSEKRIIYRNPIFFKTLMYFICNYLAVYTCRKEETLRTLTPGEFIDKTPYQEQLLHELYEDNKCTKAWLEKCTPANKQEHSEQKKKNVALLKLQQQSEAVRQRRIKEATDHFRETGELPQDVNIFHTYADIVKLKRELYGPDQNQYS